MHEEFRETVETDLLQSLENRDIIEIAKSGELLAFLFPAHLLLGRWMVFLKVEERDRLFSQGSNQTRDLFHRVVEMMGSECDPDILADSVHATAHSGSR